MNQELLDKLKAMGNAAEDLFYALNMTEDCLGCSCHIFLCTKCSLANEAADRAIDAWIKITGASHLDENKTPTSP